MDLGVFCPVVNNHNVVSTNLDHYEPTWELNRDFVQTAEDAGFKFALSQVTLAGWGGPTEQWDRSLESFTLMAALGGGHEQDPALRRRSRCSRSRRPSSPAWR